MEQLAKDVTTLGMVLVLGQDPLRQHIRFEGFGT